MSKAYGRWTRKGEQWSRVTERISARVSMEDYKELMEALGKANIGEALTCDELTQFEEFLVLYARAVRR